MRATEVEVAVQPFRQAAGERDEIAFLRDIDDEAEQFFACFRGYGSTIFVDFNGMLEAFIENLRAGTKPVSGLTR